MKPLAMLSPLCLCLFAASAWADLEPFTLGASETLAHDSNVGRTDSAKVADWYSTTELRGGVDQALGRDQLVGSAAVNYTGYRSDADRKLNYFGYQGALRLDWNAIGDLSGSLGADSRRRRYTAGFDEFNGTVGTSQEEINIETDNHAYAKFLLGGPSRWSIFLNEDVSWRRFSSRTFDVNNEQQWSNTFGTNYATSPDLSFGITGNYTRGSYPDYGFPADFDSKSLSATTRWQASGNSSLSAALGYTTQASDLQPTVRFVSGNLYWNWTPPSHFGVNLGVSRSTDGGAAAGNVSTLNDPSVNTTASLGVTYVLTAKVNLVANEQYVVRKYASATVVNNGGFSFGDSNIISGSDRSQRVSLGARYQASRTINLGCSFAHEVRRGSAVLAQILASNYVDNLAQCTASIDLN